MKGRMAFALTLVLIGGAIALDRVSPARPAKAATVSLAPDAGALSCPYLTESGGHAYLGLANVGARAASVRVGILPEKGPPIQLSATLPPASTKMIRVPSGVTARAAAVVEYSGGIVVASHVLTLPGANGPPASKAGSGAAECQRPGGADVVVTQLRTANADTTLTLFNPGSADADVTTTFIADGRVVEPIRLQHRVVPSHARFDMRLGDYAFNARAITAIVHASAGRVVPEALQRSTTGVELIPGQFPTSSAVVIAGRTGGGASVGLGVIGQDDSGFDARLINNQGQVSASGFPTSLPPYTTHTQPVPDQGAGAAAAYAFDVSIGSPIVAGTTWVSSRRGVVDESSLPAAVPSSRWAAVVPAVDQTATTGGMIVNPGSTPVVVQLTLIAPSGTTRRQLTLPAGRMTLFSAGLGSGAFGVLLEADAPVVLAMQSLEFTAKLDFHATALLGDALTVPRPVAVGIDPRVGVPAP